MKFDRSFVRDLTWSIVLALVLTFISYWLGLHFQWETSLNWIEVLAVFTSYVSTVLCLVERRFNYYAGMVSSVFYAILFLQYDLVASQIVNWYLVAYLWFGWWRWGKDKQTKPVGFVKAKMWPVYILLAGAGYLLVYEVAKAFGGTFLWTDSLILVLTILAQLLLDNKKWENWAVWLIMDVFATIEYYHSGLYLVGFQYIFFTLNTFAGMFFWWRSYHRKDDVKTVDEIVPTQKWTYPNASADAGYTTVVPR